MHLKIDLAKILNSILGSFGLVLLRGQSYQRLIQTSQLALKLETLLLLEKPEYEKISESLGASRSQLGQDLIALIVAGFKSNGYFVEFGAASGIQDSNTYLLEKRFGWNGILAEPARVWTQQLQRNRSALISDKAVWIESGTKLRFLESGQLGTLVQFRNSDNHHRSGKEYFVDSITLNDLLEDHRAPKYIDYLSVDTEGSEFDILSQLDWGKWEFGFISVEHNFTNQRPLIQDLLISHGYFQIRSDVSAFDDWFVHEKFRTHLTESWFQG